MNWEAIGAVAELVGAIAVVASLLYLAIQVRHSTEVSRATAFQAIFDGVTTHNNYMFGPDNVDLVIRCLRSYPDVGVEDRMVYDNLMANLMNYFEASYEAADAQTLGDETMQNWATYFETRFFCYKGAVEWWAKAQDLWPPHIRSWVDRRVAQADGTADYWGLLESSADEEH